MNRREFFGALAVIPATPVVAFMPPLVEPAVVADVPNIAEIADAVWNTAIADFDKIIRGR